MAKGDSRNGSKRPCPSDWGRNEFNKHGQSVEVKSEQMNINTGSDLNFVKQLLLLIRSF